MRLPQHLRSICRLPLATGRKGFSLIELLTVMAIISALLILLGTSMGNAGKAAALESAGSRVVSVIAQARQQALSRNVMSAVVVSTDTSEKGGMRALTLYEIASRADGAEWSAADWKQSVAWEVLPDGVLIDDSTFERAETAAYPPLPEVRFRGQTVDSYRYLLFSPNGVLPRGETARIRLVEGVLAQGAAGPVYTRRTDTGGPANIYEITVLVTGLTKIDRPVP